MNASRTDQPRTSPVALRTKTWRSSPSPPAATDAISPSSGCLTARQHEPLDLLLAVHLDDGAQQLPLLVRAAGVDAQRLPQPARPARLVDVPVQRERRLVALDRLAHRGRPARHGRAPRILE